MGGGRQGPVEARAARGKCVDGLRVLWGEAGGWRAPGPRHSLSSDPLVPSPVLLPMGETLLVKRQPLGAHISQWTLDLGILTLKSASAKPCPCELTPRTQMH